MTNDFNFDENQAKPACPDCLCVPTAGPVDPGDLCAKHRKNREVRAATQKRIRESLKRFDEMVNSL